MESLRAMFPDTPDSTLSHALATSNGDVSAAVEQLLPASEQVAHDAALARALQHAETGGETNSYLSTSAPTTTTDTDAGSGLADMAKPVLDGLAAAGAAAKAAVEYVANEFAAVTAGPSSASSPRTPTRRTEDDSSVIAGGYNSRTESTGMHMRANRGSGRAAPQTGFKKDD